MRDQILAALDSLVRLGGGGFARDLVTLYAEQMQERLVGARDASARGDVAALAKLAHDMRSSSAQLGATGIVDACESMEEAADRGDLEEAANALGVLDACFQLVERQLAARLSTLDRADPRRTSEMDRSAKRARIAVVEDNADNRLLVDAILGDRFALDEYDSGTQALAGMRARLPDLVLLDVSLPGMDGLEVLVRMRNDDTLRSVPVVAVTAHVMAGDRARYLAAGFDGYVPKPIDDETVLLDIVDTLLARRSCAEG